VIDNDDDIKWVKAQRPEVAPPDAEATGWARASLMFHADRSSRLACVESPPCREASPRRGLVPRFFRSRRGVAVAAAAAVLAAVGIGGAFSVLPHVGNNGVLGVDQAYAKPLVQLATHVAAAPLTGDATLVEHSNAIEGQSGFTGADLYLDNGRYYYAETAAGLPAAVKGGPQDYTLKPVVDAMASVSSADPQTARAAFLKAIDPQWADDTQHEASARQDNVIWVAGIDVLGAAYGRPDVLAGMLRALATVAGVTVTPGTYQGVKTLEISMQVPGQTTSPNLIRASLAARLKALKAAGDTTKAERAQIAALTAKLAATPASSTKTTIPAHVTQATVDASDGALLRYTDIGLVVTYHVSRVNAAAYGL